MRTETELTHEPMQETPNGSRIWVTVTVDGVKHRFIHASGPKDDVKAYFDGMLTQKELRARWDLPEEGDLLHPDPMSYWYPTS